MRIRRTEKSDLQEIMRIYEYAVTRMRAAGNLTQWVNGYPSVRDILADICGGNSYVLESEGRLAGVFAFVIGEDPNYSEIEGEWPDNATYGTIHRIAAAPGASGIADRVFDFCRGFGMNIRIDTHADNRHMLEWIERNNFEYRGIVKVADGTPRKAFQWTCPGSPAEELEIKEIVDDKSAFMPLLLIGDEQQDMVERYLDSARLYIGFICGRAVACCAVCEDADSTVEIKNLAVVHEFRKRGIGRGMIEHIKRQYPASRLILGTGETPSTLRFYRNCGFTYSHRIPDFFTTNYDHPIVEDGIVLKDMLYLTLSVTRD